MVSLAPRTLEGIPSNSLGDSHIREALVCKSWRRSTEGTEMPVANLGWSKCLWSLVSSPQVPLLLRAPQSPLDRGGRDRQAESPNNHVHNSSSHAGKLPGARDCFPVFLAESLESKDKDVERNLRDHVVPLLYTCLQSLQESPVALCCSPATP